MVQPDLAIICDTDKIEERGCNGAPDMVVEVLSPSTRKYDQTVKLKKYLEAGIREYWIVDPDNQILFTYLLENKKYIIQVYDENQSAPVSVLDGCSILLNDVFASIDR